MQPALGTAEIPATSSCPTAVAGAGATAAVIESARRVRWPADRRAITNAFELVYLK
jgi:hypothetical protein